jgi:hypothetical protein
MQARFYRQLLERGLTADDLVQSYGVTVSQIQDWVRADAVYRLACSLDFPDEVKAKVQNNREFPLSTLERLVESQPIRDFLMLKPDPEEVLVSAARPEAFLKAFRQVVADVATGKIDSRVANSADNITEYVESLGNVKPSEKSRSRFSIRDHLSQTEQPTPVVNTKAGTRKKTHISPSAIPKGLKCFCTDSRVEATHRKHSDDQVEIMVCEGLPAAQKGPESQDKTRVARLEPSAEVPVVANPRSNSSPQII